MYLLSEIKTQQLATLGYQKRETSRRKEFHLVAQCHLPRQFDLSINDIEPTRGEIERNIKKLEKLIKFQNSSFLWFLSFSKFA